jgi:hypothetical protein
MGMKFELRRDAVKALVSAQFPWVELNDITCWDNSDWVDHPHYVVKFVDDGKHRELKINITIDEV